jgi:hypothetical protein
MSRFAYNAYIRLVSMSAAVGAAAGGVSIAAHTLRDENAARAVFLTPSSFVAGASWGAVAGAAAGAVFPITIVAIYCKRADLRKLKSN